MARKFPSGYLYLTKKKKNINQKIFFFTFKTGTLQNVTFLNEIIFFICCGIKVLHNIFEPGFLFEGGKGWRGEWFRMGW